ncbi:MAG TPA: retropepsin-like aspartic protease, partial [Chlamydiales bacterium]|nr:retropepsin-like aspartic protease [Chlamydiales bacterium]
MIRNISCKLLPGKKSTIFLRKKGNQLSINVLVKTKDTGKYVEAKALIDSGCTGSAIDRDFVKKHQINRQRLPHNLKVLNADGTENSAGRITHHVPLMMRIGQKHWEEVDFGITKLDDHDIFLGYDWLASHNPEINWATGGIRFSRCSNECEQMEVFRRSNISMDIKITEHLAKEKKEWKEIVPKEYHQYPEVFEEVQFNKLPEHRVWDHKIDFVEGTDLSKLQCRVYPLTKEEDKEMNKFIDENLATGRIVRSESEIASPFFFVKKKTADLRPVQDYRKVNEATKKNRYPLPLINELLDK